MKEKTENLYQSFSFGDIVELDKGHSNSSHVMVIRQDGNRMFTTISNAENEWDVMTDRLSTPKIDTTTELRNIKNSIFNTSSKALAKFLKDEKGDIF